MIIEIGDNLSQAIVFLGFLYLLRAVIYAWAYQAGEKETDEDE